MLDQHCTKNCTSVEHGNKISSALTKREISDAELCAYLNHICEFCGSSKDASGRSALHMAASCGRRDVCKWLICQKQARIDEKDRESGYTPLHRSVFYGKIDVAALMIKLGSNPNILDLNDLSPLEHASEDNPLNPAFRFNLTYVWGSNSNYTLGPTQAKHVPELLDAFHKSHSHSDVLQIVLGKFHSVIVTDTSVYTYGHAQGGRLGLGVDKTVLEPTEVKFTGINGARVVSACVGRDHSLFLTDTGFIYATGLNTHFVLGIQPPLPQLLSPRAVHVKDKLIGIACNRYHSIAWSESSLYTWGLNAGQLGHAKGPEDYVVSPKPVSAFPSPCKILDGACSYGATALALESGDVYVLHEFQCRRIASKELGIKAIDIIGGKLTSSQIQVEKGELKVVILKANGTLLVWQESDPHLNRCIFSLTRLLNVKEVHLNKTGICFLTVAREVFTGKFKPRKRATVEQMQERSKTKAFNSFLDKNECVMVTVSKVHKIYGADSLICDEEGENFAALHINVTNCMKKSPEISASTMVEDFKAFIENVDMGSDMEFKIGDRLIPVHKYIIECGSEKLIRISKGELKNVSCDIFKQLIKYLYTNCCDLLTEGPIPMNLNMKSNEKSRNSETNAMETNKKSAFEVYSSQKSDAGKESKVLDPLRLLQEAAKNLGVNQLYKDLNSFECRNGKIRMKENKHFKPRLLSFDQNKYPDSYDVAIQSKNGKIIEVHKCILAARSEFFANMFSLRWNEMNSKIQISLPFPQSTIHHLMSYLYTDQVHLENEDADGISSLLILADHILLVRLIEICEFELAKLISLKTVFKLLLLSHFYNACQLKLCCMEYVCLNLPYVLEGRNLEQLEVEILEDIVKFYAEWNVKMGYRVITPFSDAIADDVIKKISISHPVNMDFDEEIVKSVKTAHRKRHRSYKISEKAEIAQDIEIAVLTPKIEINTKAVHNTKSIEITPRLHAINLAREKLSEIKDENIFVNLNKDFPDLNTSFGSPPAEHFIGSPPIKLKEKRTPAKLSQKQRKRLSSENEAKSIMPEVPKNPWKIIEPASPIGSPENLNISMIITEEKRQKENLTKIKSKLLVYTQMEDKALEDLYHFYNADNVYDEIIAVERVGIGLVAAPVWVQK